MSKQTTEVRFDMVGKHCFIYLVTFIYDVNTKIIQKKYSEPNWLLMNYHLEYKSICTSSSLYSVWWYLLSLKRFCYSHSKLIYHVAIKKETYFRISLGYTTNRLSFKACNVKTSRNPSFIHVLMSPLNIFCLFT